MEKETNEKLVQTATLISEVAKTMRLTTNEKDKVELKIFLRVIDILFHETVRTGNCEKTARVTLNKDSTFAISNDGEHIRAIIISDLSYEDAKSVLTSVMSLFNKVPSANAMYDIYAHDKNSIGVYMKF